MKNIVSILAASLLVLSATSAFAQSVGDGSKTFKVDAAKSKIAFLSEAPAEKIKGTANGALSGEVTINLANVSETTGKIILPVKSMATGNKLRDRHMKGKDWLNGKKNPNITFTIESLTGTKLEGKAVTGTAVGKININGVSAPAKANVVLKVAAAKGIFKVEIKKMVIKLADHKVAGKKGVVGDKVGTTIEISGVVYGKG